ncbi:MAG: aminotransferase class I/II-fold pyridoxal phosphate-dependent enzyme, partial [Treponema sp.]|nr:aminotransferase class I/II-fold pyridoxal phosphate-dependent enzyme [Treponema sp.]
FVWGFRAGFVTFGCKGFTKEQYQALVTKLMGTIRSSVSCSSTPPQSFLLKAMTDESEEFEEQKIEYRAVLEERYGKVRAFVNSHSSKVVEPLPFNSGYFMSFEVKGKDAEELRKKLLHEYGIGTVSIDSHTLRVAFSSLEAEQIDEVYATIYKAADEM